MKMIGADLIQDLHDHLRYEPEEGAFYWKKITSRRVKIGRRAGVVQTTHPVSGATYRYISFKTRKFLEHHLVFLFETGTIPDQIDHRDGNGLNNQFSNLRVATDSQNRANTLRNANNTSGFRGVTKSGNKWVARLEHFGQRFQLGSFENKEDAHKAYLRKQEELFGQYALVNRRGSYG